MGATVNVPRRQTAACQSALLATVGSVLGGLAGYSIGNGLMASVGQWIIDLYNFHEQLQRIRELYLDYTIAADQENDRTAANRVYALVLSHGT